MTGGGRMSVTAMLTAAHFKRDDYISLHISRFTKLS